MGVKLSALALVSSGRAHADGRGLGAHVSDSLQLLGVIASTSLGAGLLAFAEASVLRLADGDATVDLELLELLARVVFNLLLVN